ncbi:unnamed protein product [Allacma fusca]|uniref:Uncharacterized protein n=1 Tax=Allacma fusca TaxID=39272 RepID=A0A8J2NWP3_9HEXA|nr:unnamed protein product [Allacma fusca]
MKVVLFLDSHPRSHPPDLNDELVESEEEPTELELPVNFIQNKNTKRCIYLQPNRRFLTEKLLSEMRFQRSSDGQC